MKHLKYILGVSLAAVVCTSCENFFDEKQIHNDYKITDTRTIDYTLTRTDYKSIVYNDENNAKALAACTPEDSSAYEAFLRIETEQAFNAKAAAADYIPAFIKNLYPQLSSGSLMNVTYNINEGKPAYIDELGKTEKYTLTAEDYAKIWEKEGIEYLTPNTVGKLAEVLPADKDSGAILAVVYEYKNYEPSTGGSEEEEEEKGFYWGTPAQRGYYSPTEIVEAYAAGTLKDNDSINVGGIISEWYSTSLPAAYKNLSYYITDGTNKFEMYNAYSINRDSIVTFDYVSKTEGTATDQSGRTFAIGDTIIGTGKFTYYNKYDVYEFQKGCYITELRPAAKTTTAPRKAQAQADGKVSVLYQYNSTSWNAYKQSSVKLTVLPEEVYTAIGAKYISDKAVLETYLNATYPYAVADAKYAVVYAVKDGYAAAEYTYNGSEFIENLGLVAETATFSLSDVWGSTIYYKQAIMGEGQGKLVIQNVDLGGLTYIWSYASTYGMKASGYASSEAHVVESWLVTPAISVKKAMKPALNFDQAINYGPTDVKERQEQCAVLVSTDYAGDVTTCTWEVVAYSEDEDYYPVSNSWSFVNTGDLDLSKYAGQEIVLGFRYKTEQGSTCSTWELKNLLVHEADAE